MTASAHSGSRARAASTILPVMRQAAGQRAGTVVLEVLPDHGRVGHRGERRGQLRVACLGHEQAVELAVQVDDRGQVLAVAVPPARAHPPGQQGQLVQLRRGQPGHRLAERRTARAGAGPRRSPAARRCSTRSPGRRGSGSARPALGGQPGQRSRIGVRLTDSCRARTASADPGAGRDPPGQDALPDDVSGLLRSLSHGAPGSGRRGTRIACILTAARQERKTRLSDQLIRP